jgi:hypothetical protein
MPQVTILLSPARKYWPIYQPPYDWQKIPLATDPNFPNAVWPGYPAPPWPPVPAKNPGKMPFGMWPATKTIMRDQLKSWPSFGVIKVRVPGEKYVQGQQISFLNIKMHVRSYDEYKIWTVDTPMGQRHYLLGKPWDQYQKRHLTEGEIEEEKEAMASVAPPKPKNDLFT